jgi:riboflavin kinase/FMN adenylyltransferase
MYLLEQSGLDHVVIVEFTREFAQTTSESFVIDYLLGKLHANTIIVGFNHHFGHNRSGDYQYLFELSRKFQFEVEEIPMQDIENEAVSSTRIRKALHEGHIGRANAYLNHSYFIIGKTNGRHLLYNNSFVEIVVEEQEKMLPPNGRYAAKIQDNKSGLNLICEIFNKRVFVGIVDENPLPEMELYHLELHKTIRLFDGKDQTKTYEIDKNEVFELIY